jgi:GT2 family glycosyltransferase
MPVLLSIIICTRNRSSELSHTLNALSNVTVPAAASAEVIVVDNGSTDDTRTCVNNFTFGGQRIKYIWEPNGGKSVALNTGIGSSRGDIIILTDDDIRPVKSWLGALTAPIIAETYDAVSGRVVLAPHLARSWMSLTHAGWLASTDYLNPAAPESAVGANMAFRRSILDRVGGFDPELGPGRLGLWEDTLFSLQLKLAGFKLGMAPDAQVEHHFDESRLKRPAFLSRARAEARSSAYVAWHWKHQASPGARRRVANLRLHLLAKRVLRWKDWHASEGMPEWEMNLITGIEFEKQFRMESRRPRAYEKFGTRKLTPPASPIDAHGADKP